MARQSSSSRLAPSVSYLGNNVTANVDLNSVDGLVGLFQKVARGQVFNAVSSLEAAERSG